jgi:intracellular septation protein
MRTLIDLIPILVFFGIYKAYTIFVATAALIVMTILQMSYIYATEKKLEFTHKLTLVLVIVFGALTLIFHNDDFIKWKPTVLYGLMALILAVGLWGLKKNFIKLFLEKQLELPALVWNRLAIVWVLYCLFMAILNAYIVMNYSTEDWMKFKLWGYIFPLIFFIGQGVYLATYLRNNIDESSDEKK